MQDFSHTFTLLSADDFKYTQQRYQISFYPKMDLNETYVFSIGWHTILQKPVIISNKLIAVMDVSPYASLRNILVDLQHSHARINVEVGYSHYDMNILLDMPIYDAPMVQFKMYSSFEVYIFWNNYWNEQAVLQRYKYIPHNYEDAPVFNTYSYNQEDKVYDQANKICTEWSYMTEEDKQHISFEIAFAAIDE